MHYIRDSVGRLTSSSIPPAVQESPDLTQGLSDSEFPQKTHRQACKALFDSSSEEEFQEEPVRPSVPVSREATTQSTRATKNKMPPAEVPRTVGDVGSVQTAHSSWSSGC